MQIFISIIYILMTASLVSGFMMTKKSKTALPLVTWGIIVWVGMMCFTTFASGVLTLVHIPVCLLSLAIVDGLAGGFLWWRMIKNNAVAKRDFQKYDINQFDSFVVIFMLAFVIVYWGKVYGTAMIPAFYVPDGSAHYMEAMRVIRDRNVTDMYYHSVNNAVLIELFSPIIIPPHFYKAYLLGELINLFLSGMALYCLMRPLARDKFLGYISVAAPIVYIIGYPLNNALYGFVYLEEGITVIAVIILILDMYCDDVIDTSWGVPLLCLGCCGIALSYMLFAPAVFVAAFVRILGHQKRADKLISKRSVWICLAVFLVPCILTIYFAYGGIFATTEETVGGSIAAEGTIYRDLFSNFLPWLPFAGYGAYVLTKQKKQRSLRLFGALFLLQMILFFTGAYFGLVSTYYFYKMHYLLWMIVFALAFAGLALIPKIARPFPVSALVCWVIVFVMFITNIDGKLNLHNPYLADPKAAGFFNNIYNENLIMVAADPGDPYCIKYDKNKLALLDSTYYYLTDNDIDKKSFMPVTDWSDSYWVIAILDLESEYFKWWPNPISYITPKYRARMEEADILMIFTNSEGCREFSDILENGYEMLYSNDAGILVKKL